MKEQTIKELIEALDKTEEFFFVSKQGEEFKLVHSELSDCDEWLEMIDHFKNGVKDKVIKLRGNNDATDDLLNDADISSN